MRSRDAELPRRPEVIRLTGGASADPLLRQIVADVFQTTVTLGGSGESAALGAAMRAANAVSGMPFAELSCRFNRAETQVAPERALAGCYDEALERYRKLENHRIGS